MSQKSCWEILGIEATQDQKNIKRAYARLSRTCHPEDNPEEFRELHDAYESAMRISALLARQKISLSQAEAEGQNADGGEKASGLYADPAVQNSSMELEQLIQRGLERDSATRAERLLEKIVWLHNHTPDTVNTSNQVFEDVMEQWEELFVSNLFEQGHMDSGFLENLADWLRENRGHLNRAEAVCFYRIYGFQTIPDKDTDLWEVYVQIMTAAHKYERDMVHYAGMPPFIRNYAPVFVKETQTRSRGRGFGVLCAVIIAILIFPVIGEMIAPVRSADSKQEMEVIREYSHDSSEAHGTGWAKEYAFTKVFPDGYPKSKTEISRENDMPQSLWSVCNTQQKINDSVPDSLVCVEQGSGKKPYVYEVTAMKDAYNEDVTRRFYKQTSRDAMIISRFYVKRNPFHGGGFKILADSYLPETFLKIADKNGIPGVFWIDEDYEQHLVLTCDSVERMPELTASLIRTCNDFMNYHRFNRLRQPLPPMNLTILFGPSTWEMVLDGPESNPVIADLVRGTYEPESPAVHRTYKAYYDTEHYKLDFHPDPVPATSSDADAAGSDYWVSHIVFGPAWDVGIHLFPECSGQAVMHHMLEGLESLDWVASQEYK